MVTVDVGRLTATQAKYLLQPSITTWSRLEPMSLTRGDLTPGLQAQMADPLWLLGRQWQFAELAAEDAASPVVVHVEGTAGPFTRFHAGPVGPDPAAGSVDTPSLPIEVAVEAELPARLPERVRAEGGQHLLRLLATDEAVAPADRAAIRSALVSVYSFPPGDDALSTTDPSGAARRRVLAGRIPDAERIVADLQGHRADDGTVTSLPPALAGLPAAGPLTAVLSAWLGWYEGYLAHPVGAGGGGAAPYSWNPYRQEYSFAAQATTGNGDLLLRSDEYTDGHLDWYAFDVAVGPSLGAPSRAIEPTPVRERLLASPIRFPGMPADRFWEMEDSRVYLGRLEAAPHDLARLGLVEYALAFGNDWYLAPVDLPYGSVAEISKVTVLDTFGGTTELPRGVQAATHERPGWCMYHLAGADDAGRLADVFVLPRTVHQPLEGPPLEEVALFRDEQADLVWGVERVVQGQTGEPVAWSQLAGRVSLRQTIPSDLGDAKIVYRLMTPLPENWIPFVAVPAGGRPEGSLATDLERQPLIRFHDDGTVSLVHPRGLLLRSADTADVTTDRLRIAEEEVPRDGILIRRAVQLARSEGGGTVLWVGRSKVTGTGEGYAGLRFDTALPPGSI
jgi:hypothetical protein